MSFSPHTRVFNYHCSSQVDCFAKSITLQPGVHLVECWGASGGDVPPAKGGRGSFVSGIIVLQKRTKLFLFIGAQGHTGVNKTSFNGGGSSPLTTLSSSLGSSGGGSTDIRLINSSDFEGLSSRIIVASGGGGSNLWSSGASGGDGGTLQGFPGKSVYIPGYYQLSTPSGGTQNKGGKRGECATHPQGCLSEYNGGNGQFGSGGRATLMSYGGGGGGGYFGGGGGSVTDHHVSSGAGGSSFISGHKGCFAIDPLSPNIFDIQMLSHPNHSSGIIFQNTHMKSGSETIETAEGNEETGHTGNGAIKITTLSTCNFQTNRYSIFQSYHIFRCISYFILISN